MYVFVLISGSNLRIILFYTLGALSKYLTSFRILSTCLPSGSAPVLLEAPRAGASSGVNQAVSRNDARVGVTVARELQINLGMAVMEEGRVADLLRR